jgi:hypothetical protein
VGCPFEGQNLIGGVAINLKKTNIFGYETNPSFPVFNGYEPFILDFKPF